MGGGRLVRELPGVGGRLRGGLLEGGVVVPDAPVVGGDGLLDVLGQVVPQVPPVGDLDRAAARRRGRPRRSARPGPGRSPRRRDGHPARRAKDSADRSGQHVDGPAGLDVDQDGAVDVAPAQREVVDLLRRRSKSIYPDPGIIPTADAAL